MSRSCTYWANDRPCGQPATDRYLTGLRCTTHTPSAIAGKAEPPTPDPARTLAGLRAQAGRPNIAPPITASQLYDDRAVASGKRRASEHQIRDARMRLGIVAPDLPAPTPPAADPADLFGEATT